MKHQPQAITEAAGAFDGLPGVGPRAALRYAYWLVTQPKDKIAAFARAIQGLADTVQTCTSCHAFSDGDVCAICRDPRRDQSIVCVVASNQDLRAVEESGAYRGLYHVLGGLLDPIEGRTPETLHIAHLLQRLEQSNGVITELIFGFDPDVRGDTTALYLDRQVVRFGCRITRFARGLPNGAQIEYADGTTVAEALVHRHTSHEGA